MRYRQEDETRVLLTQLWLDRFVARQNPWGNSHGMTERRGSWWKVLIVLSLLAGTTIGGVWLGMWLIDFPGIMAAFHEFIRH